MSLILNVSENALNALATQLSSHLDPGQLILLTGTVGAGKTTFTQFIGNALSSTDPINSPSYSLVQSYRCNHPSIKQIHHMDLYRLNTQSDIHHLDLDRYLEDTSAICIIEWSDKWTNAKSLNALEITISIESPTHRQLRIKGPNHLLEKLKSIK